MPNCDMNTMAFLIILEPFNDTLQTTLFGYDMVKNSEMAKKTLEHI